MLASRILSLLGERTPICGQHTIGSTLVDDTSIAPPVDAILCRKNVTAIWQLAVGIEAGHKPAIRLSAAEIEAFAGGVDQLLAGGRAFRPAAFSLFETWKDAQLFAQSGVGCDLLPVVRIVDVFGSAYLRALARRTSPEASADYVISTVHRAKAPCTRGPACASAPGRHSVALEVKYLAPPHARNDHVIIAGVGRNDTCHLPGISVRVITNPEQRPAQGKGTGWHECCGMKSPFFGAAK